MSTSSYIVEFIWQETVLSDVELTTYYRLFNYWFRVYVLATYEAISGQVPTCARTCGDWEDQTTVTITQYPTRSQYPCS